QHFRFVAVSISASSQSAFPLHRSQHFRFIAASISASSQPAFPLHRSQRFRFIAVSISASSQSVRSARSTTFLKFVRCYALCALEKQKPPWHLPGRFYCVAGSLWISARAKFDFIYLRWLRGVGQRIRQAVEQRLGNFHHGGFLEPQLEGPKHRYNRVWLGWAWLLPVRVILMG
ncbi:MAG: hypothetical protein WCP31_10250, partial [Chloroflexales bacterium]